MASQVAGPLTVPPHNIPQDSASEESGSPRNNANGSLIAVSGELRALQNWLKDYHPSSSLTPKHQFLVAAASAALATAGSAYVVYKSKEYVTTYNWAIFSSLFFGTVALTISATFWLVSGLRDQEWIGMLGNHFLPLPEQRSLIGQLFQAHHELGP